MNSSLVKKKFKAMTLIEIIIVVAIIGILSAVGVINVVRFVNETRIGAANANAKVLFNSAQTAVTAYHNGRKDLVKAGTGASAVEYKIFEEAYLYYNGKDLTITHYYNVPSGGVEAVNIESAVDTDNWFQKQLAADITSNAKEAKKQNWAVYIKNNLVLEVVCADNSHWRYTGSYPRKLSLDEAYQLSNLSLENIGKNNTTFDFGDLFGGTGKDLLAYWAKLGEDSNYVYNASDFPSSSATPASGGPIVVSPPSGNYSNTEPPNFNPPKSRHFDTITTKEHESGNKAYTGYTSSTALPTGVSFSGTGVVDWDGSTPVGEYNFTISNETDIMDIKFIVTGKDETTITVNAKEHKADSSSTGYIGYNAKNLPAGVTFDKDTGVLTWGNTISSGDKIFTLEDDNNKVVVTLAVEAKTRNNDSISIEQGTAGDKTYGVDYELKSGNGNGIDFTNGVLTYNNSVPVGAHSVVIENNDEILTIILTVTAVGTPPPVEPPPGEASASYDSSKDHADWGDVIQFHVSVSGVPADATNGDFTFTFNGANIDMNYYGIENGGTSLQLQPRIGDVNSGTFSIYYRGTKIADIDIASLGFVNA